ncbi:MAG: hypothetical protein DRP65_11340 [Planctomycetota bacterium]|nr:MAG: hypothetical protein DRP65_11340 [Planctomycetota bacterium]
MANNSAKQNKEKMIEEEVEDLRRELEHFQQEKERVRTIVGKIGGVPTFNIRLFNIVFIAVMAATLFISLLSSELRLLMIELATVALALKILYMMHCQSKVNHFQLWMQSSIEWRINEIMKLLRKNQRDAESESARRES